MQCNIGECTVRVLVGAGSKSVLSESADGGALENESRHQLTRFCLRKVPTHGHDLAQLAYYK